VTMRALSDQLNVSRSAAYRHFDGKNELLACVAIDGFHQLRDALREKRLQSTNDNSIVDRLHQMGLAYITFAVNHSAHYRLMFGERDWKDDDHEQLAIAGAEAYDELVQMIKAGQDAGIFRSVSSEELALATWSHVHGMASLIIDGRSSDLYEDKDRLSRVLSTIREGLLVD